MTVLPALLLSILLTAPTPDPPEPGWVRVDDERLVRLRLPQGRVLIELNPTFAPATTAQFKRLVRDGFYDGLDFYRVIDGFVAQGGDGSDMGQPPSKAPELPAEFERSWADSLDWMPVQDGDLFARETGFISGFPAARDMASGKVWLTHCPGAVAMARGNEPDSGRTDFYIVIGQAPRYLDRNLTVFGRVIDGMAEVQAIRRGSPADNGMISDPANRTSIVEADVMADLPAEDRVRVWRMETGSPAYAEMLDGRRHRSQAFFHHRPPAVLDVCQQPVPVRIEPGD